MGGTTQWPGLPICVHGRGEHEYKARNNPISSDRHTHTYQAVLGPYGVIRGVHPALLLQPAQVRLGGLLQGETISIKIPHSCTLHHHSTLTHPLLRVDGRPPPRARVRVRDDRERRGRRAVRPPPEEPVADVHSLYVCA